MTGMFMFLRHFLSWNGVNFFEVNTLLVVDKREWFAMEKKRLGFPTKCMKSGN